MKLLILLNPSAARGRARQAVAPALEVLHRAGAEFEIRESRDAGHLEELARRARDEQPAAVVAAGGDGTFHYVLNGLLPGDVPLGLIPLGRGNDFARALGVPSDAASAAAALLNGRERRVDLARVGNRLYGCVAGVGFDSAVNRYVNERAGGPRGPLAYAWGIFRCLASFQPVPLEISSDEKTFAGKVMLAVAGNCPSYGGGVRIAPRASLDDGLLDVCIVPEMPKLELLRWVPRAYRGRHLAHPRMVYFQARRVTLSSSVPLELFGDGEFISRLPATMEALPRALRVIAPEQVG